MNKPSDPDQSNLITNKDDVGERVGKVKKERAEETVEEDLDRARVKVVNEALTVFNV